MEIAFFKSKHGGLRNKVVSLWTASPYCHSELVFPDGNCFSTDKTTHQDGKFGKTRWKRIDFGEEWVKMPIEMTERQQSDLAWWCHQHTGEPYDWKAIVGFTFFTRWSTDNRWTCSQLAAAALNSVGFDIQPNPTPHELYEWCENEC